MNKQSAEYRTIRTAPQWRLLAKRCGLSAVAQSMKKAGYTVEQAIAILVKRQFQQKD